MILIAYGRYILLCKAIKTGEFGLSQKMHRLTKAAYRVIARTNDKDNNDNNPHLNWKALWSLPILQKNFLFGGKCPKKTIMVRASINSKISLVYLMCAICPRAKVSV